MPAATTAMLLAMLQLQLLLTVAGAAKASGEGSLGSYSVSGVKENSRLSATCRLTDSSSRSSNMTSLCAVQCHAASACESFGFNELAGNCELYSGTAATAGCELLSAEGWVYYEKTHFKMPTPAVGACQSGKECKNSGICLSRTEVAPGSMACACKPGFKGHDCDTQEAKPEWSDWSDFGACSVTCGVGLKMRNRRCLAAGETVQSDLCGSGSPEQYLMCNTTVCPSWSQWSAWSACSTVSSCGQGVRQRSRSCSNGGQIGKDCLGSSVENTPCESVSCGIDSAPVSLSPIEYEPYSVGKGFIRIYNDLFKAEGYVCADGFDQKTGGAVVCRSLGFEGVSEQNVEAPAMPSASTAKYFLTNLNCAGSESSLQMCQHAGWSNQTQCNLGRAAYVLCKVNGGWSQWSAWESCEGKCGSANRDRTRTCNQPKPLGGGATCQGPGSQQSPCPSLAPCPGS